MTLPIQESDTDMMLQLGFVTDDLDRTSAFWSQLTGIPVAEIWYSHPPEISNATFQGEATPAGFRQAFYRYKGTFIELMEPDESPSAWRDWLERHGPGLHHIGFRIKDLDVMRSSFADAGFPTMQVGHLPGGRYAYADTERAGGFIVELLEFEPELANWLEETYPLR
jgi:catechol 2,3-dioxygenase-like lactoylglutathione lyase family enzyme